ncbi:MAG: hypothetical protein E7014_05210 [Alphaproteobacteria bacterium]|nr:hypothetical protein [Alphaproteobacteria bacterium]
MFQILGGKTAQTMCYFVTRPRVGARGAGADKKCRSNDKSLHLPSCRIQSGIWCRTGTNNEPLS